MQVPRLHVLPRAATIATIVAAAAERATPATLGAATHVAISVAASSRMLERIRDGLQLRSVPRLVP
jgi:hypothetical protein